jgi:hypothetical protein
VSDNPIESPVDFVVIAGKRTPGLATITGLGTPRKWEEVQGYGLTGATLRYLGNSLSSFTISLRLYSEQEWADWYAFKPTVDRTPSGKRPQALACSHPWLRDANVVSMIVEDLLAPEQTGDGEWTIAIKCKQFRAVRRTLAKPEAAQQQPVDAWDAKILANTESINALAGKLAEP